MIVEIVMAAVVGAAQTPTWVWTLYEGSGPVVLANERPDTPDLRSTLECVPHTGLVRLSLYQSAIKPGQAGLSAGEAVAQIEAAAGEDGAVSIPLRTDQSVFARFVSTGELVIVEGGARQTVEIPDGDLAKLRRLADLCSG